MALICQNLFKFKSIIYIKYWYAHCVHLLFFLNFKGIVIWRVCGMSCENTVSGSLKKYKCNKLKSEIENIMDFIKTFTTNNGYRLPQYMRNKTIYINELLLKCEKSKSFYILFDNGVTRHNNGDLMYIIKTNSNLCLFYNTYFEIDNIIFKKLSNYINFDYKCFDDIDLSELSFGEQMELIKDNIIEASKKKYFIELKSKFIKKNNFILYKANPDFLFTEKNINLMKMNLINSI